MSNIVESGGGGEMKHFAYKKSENFIVDRKNYKKTEHKIDTERLS
jgi:hypothetical protein